MVVVNIFSNVQKAQHRPRQGQGQVLNRWNFFFFFFFKDIGFLCVLGFRSRAHCVTFMAGELFPVCWVECDIKGTLGRTGESQLSLEDISPYTFDSLKIPLKLFSSKEIGCYLHLKKTKTKKNYVMFCKLKGKIMDFLPAYGQVFSIRYIDSHGQCCYK